MVFTERDEEHIKVVTDLVMRIYDKNYNLDQLICKMDQIKAVLSSWDESYEKVAKIKSIVDAG